MRRRSEPAFSSVGLLPHRKDIEKAGKVQTVRDRRCDEIGCCSRRCLPHAFSTAPTVATCIPYDGGHNLRGFIRDEYRRCFSFYVRAKPAPEYYVQYQYILVLIYLPERSCTVGSNDMDIIRSISRVTLTLQQHRNLLDQMLDNPLRALVRLEPVWNRMRPDARPERPRRRLDDLRFFGRPHRRAELQQQATSQSS